MATALPGYYIGLRGECSAEEYAEQENEYRLTHYFTQILYQGHDVGSFYLRSFPQFFQAVVEFYHHNPAVQAHLSQLQLRAAATYFYNRQLIVQMTSIPKPYSKIQPDAARLTSIPIERTRGKELQADLLHFQAFQRDVNYGIPYLLVILDPYSRFLYAEPVRSTQASAVFQALTYAIQHDNQEIYHYFRDRVQTFTVDGGVEFQGFFAQHLNDLFPHANIRIVNKKSSNLGGRPGTSGPVERVIRTLRKLIRDYSYTTSHSFLERGIHGTTGLQAVTNIYNSTPFAGLQNQSPREVMMHLIHEAAPPPDMPDVNLQRHLTNLNKAYDVHLHSRRLLQIEKRQRQERTMQQHLQNHHFVTGEGRMIIRLYHAPGLFAKEVDIRVSLETYEIVRVSTHGRKCTIRNQTSGEETEVLLTQCVLIKTPVMTGPPIIRQNLQRELHGVRTIPPRVRGDHVAVPEAPENAMMQRAVGRYQPGDFRFDVTPEIQRAIGGNVQVQQVIQAPVIPEVRRNPLRAARFQHEYEN